ncbi:MAG: cytochrome c-type biogenesis protein CcmH [Paracoccaceae bacterium]|jgi:cytochrome c-type biogenesis protein CcmH
MIGFWIVAVVLSLMVVLAMVISYLRPKDAEVPAAAYDLQVYRDQLKEVERDLERGVLSDIEGDRARTEISRRVLEADKAVQMGQGTVGSNGARSTGIIAISLVVMVGGAFGIYSQIGAPGYPDLPLETRIRMVEDARATRPDQSEVETQIGIRPRIELDADQEALVNQLRTVMEQRPEDTVGLDLLAQNEASIGNFRAARLAQTRLIEVLGETATEDQYVDLAEMMVLAAGGYVSPEAEEALARALQLSPRDGTARYYIGLMYAQQGRPDLAYPIWRNLLAESESDAPWLDPIRLQIEDVAALAGDAISVGELQQPVSIQGPTPEQIEDAANLTPEEQAAMIGAMVGGLSDRLATVGGPPQEWAQLISAYRILGDDDAADLVLAEARLVFADDAEVLELFETLPGPAQ